MSAVPNEQVPATSELFQRLATVYDWIVPLAGLVMGGARQVREDAVARLAPAPGHRVLDLGCGTGAVARLIAARLGPNGTVIGVDGSPAMLKVAGRRCSDPRIHFRHANARELPLEDQSVDCAVATLVLHELDDDTRPVAVAEVYRVLRPGGRFLVVDFASPESGLVARLRYHLLMHGSPAVERGWAADLERAGFAGVKVEAASSRVIAYTCGEKLPAAG